ncbi:uncharacterized protein LOC134727024 [Mytilus trossulus]|uniref:uncharacterized protein LOC134727024 n=1 Tax=Mytilus trossulus TaxID=6551 RepID=UPI0030070654
MFLFAIILFLLLEKCQHSQGEENYFKVLGITRIASKREIKSAYRSISKTIHPDKNQCDEFAAEKFINLTKAYDILVDDVRRSRYKIRNPYFGRKKEEYDWNIPVCTNRKPATIWESIKELYPDYINEILYDFMDWLRKTFWNGRSVFNLTNMIELQRLLHEKLITTMAAVYLRLISLKSTVYTLTDNFKSGRYNDFPEWLRRILIETEGVLNLKQYIGFLLYLTSSFLSRNVLFQFILMLFIEVISVHFLLMFFVWMKFREFMLSRFEVNTLLQVAVFLFICIGYVTAVSMLFTIKKGILHIQLPEDWILPYLFTAFVTAIYIYYEYPLHTYTPYVLVCNYTQIIIGLILATYSEKNNLPMSVFQCFIIIGVSWILLSVIAIVKVTVLFILKLCYIYLNMIAKVILFVIHVIWKCISSVHIFCKRLVFLVF